MTFSNYKFLIEQKLKELDVVAHKTAMKELPDILDVSRTTLFKWRTVKVGDKLDIPSTKLAILAKFLGCKVEELINPRVDLSHVLPQTVSKETVMSKHGMSQ